ncbi:chaperonin 10-like protein [Coniochaeta sp. 2T2.1]|nr:chaperonin 10-like protein [Coniochaeta sp. 2T2.1]
MQPRSSFTVFKGSENGTPKQSTVLKPEHVLGDRVLVRITASGLCGTDLHYKHNDMVLGHEGVGLVEAVGPDVKKLREGDRVGWGYETDSCGLCDFCLQGAEIFCPQRAIYGTSNLDQGSFASHAIWREAFLHPIPDGLSDEDAAPLQCGGATVFTALHDAHPNDTVGIMGIGGLGHLAIQFAAKMGLRVVVLSGTERKRKQAMQLGAHRFISVEKGFGELDPDWRLTKLLVTTSAQPQWDSILPLMAPKSTIYPLSVSEGNLEIPYMPLILGGINIQGSLVATRAVHRGMLAFAALHNIKPIIEKFPMSEAGIAKAMHKLEEGNVFYRAVLIPEL